MSASAIVSEPRGQNTKWGSTLSALPLAIEARHIRLGARHETVEHQSCPIRVTGAGAACTPTGSARRTAGHCRPALCGHDLLLERNIKLPEDIRRHLFDRDDRRRSYLVLLSWRAGPGFGPLITPNTFPLDRCRSRWQSFRSSFTWWHNLARSARSCGSPIGILMLMESTAHASGLCVHLRHLSGGSVRRWSFSSS